MAMRGLGLLALILLGAFCSASAEVEQFRDGPALSVRLGGAGEDQPLEDLSNDEPSSEEEDAATKASNEMEGLVEAEKVARLAAQAPAPKLKLSRSPKLWDKINDYIKAKMASPEMIDLIQAEVAAFNKKHRAAVALSQVKASEVSAQEATRIAVEAAVKAQINSPAVQMEMKATEKAVIKKETAQIEKSTDLKEVTEQAVDRAAEAVVSVEAQRATNQLKTEKTKETAIAEASRSGADISSEGKAVLKKRLAAARSSMKAASATVEAVQKLDSNLGKIEANKTAGAIAIQEIGIAAVLKDSVKKKVEQTAALKAEEAADAKIAGIAKSIQDGVKRAADAKKRDLEMKALQKQAKKKANKYKHDDDLYWNRRRQSFAHEKAMMTGKLDAWIDPQAEKKDKKQDAAEEAAAFKKKAADDLKVEKAEKIADDAAQARAAADALRQQLQAKLTPDLVESVAADSLDSVVPKADNNSTEFKLKVATDKHQSAMKFAASFAARVKSAELRVQTEAKRVENALTLNQATIAKAAVTAASTAQAKNQKSLVKAQAEVVSTLKVLATLQAVIKKKNDESEPLAVKMAKAEVANEKAKAEAAALEALNPVTNQTIADMKVKAEKEAVPEPEPLTAAERDAKNAEDATNAVHDEDTKTKAAGVEATNAAEGLNNLTKVHMDAKTADMDAKIAVAGNQTQAAAKDGDEPAQAGNQTQAATDGDKPAQAAKDGDEPAPAAKDGDKPAQAATDGDKPAQAAKDGDKPAPAAAVAAQAAKDGDKPAQAEAKDAQKPAGVAGAQGDEDNVFGGEKAGQVP